MKIANLPGGQAVGFADEMQDSHIDELVKKLVGHDLEARKLASADNMTAVLAQAFQQLSQNSSQLNQSINGISNSLGMLAQMLEANRLTIEQAALLISGKLDALAAACTAPKELVTNKEGKPTGVKVKYN